MHTGPLTDRERLLIKVAIANTLKALAEINTEARNMMLHYADKTKDDPRKQGYYDTHRQFEQLGYELEHAVEHRLYYDDDLSTNSWNVD